MGVYLFKELINNLKSVLAWCTTWGPKIRMCFGCGFCWGFLVSFLFLGWF